MSAILQISVTVILFKGFSFNRSKSACRITDFVYFVRRSVAISNPLLCPFALILSLYYIVILSLDNFATRQSYQHVDSFALIILVETYCSDMSGKYCFFTLSHQIKLYQKQAKSGSQSPWKLLIIQQSTGKMWDN